MNLVPNASKLQQSNVDQFVANLNRLSKSNFVCSPLGLVECLSLTFLGSSSATRHELSDLLDTQSDEQCVANLQEHKQPGDLINASFILTDLRVKKAYLEKCEKLAVEVCGLDQQSLRRADELIEELTKGAIKSMPSPGEYTHTMIVNVICLQFSWKTPFDDEIPNYLFQDGSRVDMMELESQDLLYFQNAEFQSVELQFKESSMTMGFILSNDHGETKQPTSETVKLISANSRETKVTLRLPKFQIQQEIDLKKQLVEQGHLQASSGLSMQEFSEQPVDWHFQILQKVAISIDEFGVAACAATLHSSSDCCKADDESVALTFDRPFSWYIRSGAKAPTVVFSGQFLQGAHFA